MGPRGGSYREIHSLPHDFEGGQTECHHLIPADCLQAGRNRPCAGTRDSNGGPRAPANPVLGPVQAGEALGARITEMLRRRDYDGALEAGIEDVRSVAGNRYDGAITQARRYYSTWHPQMPNPTAVASPGDAAAADSQANVTEVVARLTRYVEVLPGWLARDARDPGGAADASAPGRSRRLGGSDSTPAWGYGWESRRRAATVGMACRQLPSPHAPGRIEIMPVLPLRYRHGYH